MKRMISKVGLVSLVVLGLVAGLAMQADAGIVVPDSSIPPVGGEWVSDPDTQTLNYGGLVQGEDVHLTFEPASVVRTPVGSDEIIDCTATLTAIVTSYPGSPVVTFVGPMQIKVLNKVGFTTGTFAAEAVSLDAVATLDPSVRLRENPALASMGQFTITDLGGGNFGIDSFFDVYSELSPDGGATWLSDFGASETGHHLSLVPEPATLALVGLGALAAVRRRRR